MKLKLYFFGKGNEMTDAEKKLVDRIGHRCFLEVIPLAQAGVKEAEVAKRKEGDTILNKISDQEYVVAFDEHGEEMRSVQFSKWLKNKLIDLGSVTFVVGGAHGLDGRVLERANYTMRMGRMVWTRNLCRHMALEQLYRALEIDGGSNFHKD